MNTKLHFLHIAIEAELHEALLCTSLTLHVRPVWIFSCHAASAGITVRFTFRCYSQPAYTSTCSYSPALAKLQHIGRTRAGLIAVEVNRACLHDTSATRFNM